MFWCFRAPIQLAHIGECGSYCLIQTLTSSIHNGFIPYIPLWNLTLSIHLYSKMDLPPLRIYSPWISFDSATQAAGWGGSGRGVAPPAPEGLAQRARGGDRWRWRIDSWKKKWELTSQNGGFFGDLCGLRWGLRRILNWRFLDVWNERLHQSKWGAAPETNVSLFQTFNQPRKPRQ